MVALIDQFPSELQAEIVAAVRDNAAIRRKLAILRDSSWSDFVPRPNCPEEFDEQRAFIEAKDMVSFHIGGNAAGTTTAAMAKLAKFVLSEQEPPRSDTPFWIISNTYEQVCDVCWKEKLLGQGFIPDCEIDWGNVSWISQKHGWPKAVPLKAWSSNGETNWTLEFKSYEQGRTAMQAKSIGGFCFSEQFPVELFVETLRGCRDYMYPGSMFAEFTPINPDLCVFIEKLMDNTPEGWAFYRANTELNRVNLAEGWYDNFFAAVPKEMVETRKTGALASFEGVIFETFNRAIHVVESPVIPPAAFHYRGGDWGASLEHPFAWLWGCRDGMGDWLIYDEYWCNRQDRITLDHVEEILQRSREWGWPDEGVQSPFHLESFADPSRPGEINEFNVRGVPTFPAMTDVYKGIDCIRSLLRVHSVRNKPKLLISSKCVHLIDEIRKYRWLKGRSPLSVTGFSVLNPKVALPQPLKRDDDTVDALRYMIYTAEKQRGAVPGSMRHREYAQKHGIHLRRQVEPGHRREVMEQGCFTRG